MKLKKIAELINGRVVGDGDIEISGVSGITDVKDGEITFLSDKKLLPELMKSKASAVILKEPIEGLKIPFIIVKNPLYAFAQLLSYFYLKPPRFTGVHENAFVSKSAFIGENVTVYPFSYIDENAHIGSGTVIFTGVFIGENCSIGENCIIYPNVTIRERIKIGNNVIIHSGAVIGADGFGYVYEGGVHHKIPQVGGVIIEDNVEIGANVTIDRATTGDTVIGKGTKIDNLVQIGHNVKIGSNSILVAQVGIGGSSLIGENVVLGGQVGVSDHAVIESQTMIGAKSGVMPGRLQRGIYSGVPVMPHRDWLKAVSIFSRLPELYKEVKELKDRLRLLEKSKEEAI